MGLLNDGDDDSQRTFNGKFIEELRTRPSAQARWTPTDRIAMHKWLANHRHSSDTILDDPESIIALMCQVGLHPDLLSKDHFSVMRHRLVHALRYAVGQIEREHRLEVYWDPGTNTKRMKWTDEALDQVLGLRHGPDSAGDGAKP